MPNETDRAIGLNVQTQRGPVSQQAVADAMRERGWKWSQSTVWSVEQGDRPLRLAEAISLSEILGCEVSSLTSPPANEQARWHLRQNVNTTRTAFFRAEEEVRSLLHMLNFTRRMLHGIARHGGLMTEAELLHFERKLDELSVENAVEGATRAAEETEDARVDRGSDIFAPPVLLRTLQALGTTPPGSSPAEPAEWSDDGVDQEAP